MRKALTLIELIFTVVIIAIVFTVIPKIVLSLNKSDSFVIRQDALFNGVSMMKMILKLPWDDSNTESRDILSTNSSYSLFDCSSSSDFRRVGGFVGGRTCENNQNASAINNNPEQDDIGDFEGYDENTSGSSAYGIVVKVRYIDDNITYDYSNQNAIIDLNSTTISTTGTTNLKYIDINVTYQGNRGTKGRQLTQFNYTSANIGQMILRKRYW